LANCSFQLRQAWQALNSLIGMNRAMAAFWSRGYEATSIDNLVEATGINRGSLYGTFGDKRRLFPMALDRYWVNAMMEELSDPDPRRALKERKLCSVPSGSFTGS
jgi:AcrR family transcriptional regulator